MNKEFNKLIEKTNSDFNTTLGINLENYYHIGVSQGVIYMLTMLQQNKKDTCEDLLNEILEVIKSGKMDKSNVFIKDLLKDYPTLSKD